MQVFDIFDKAVALDSQACAFRKRLLYPFELWGRSGLIVFELSNIFHSISSTFIPFHPICGGKVGEAKNPSKDISALKLTYIIGLFVSNFNQSISKSNIFSTARGYLCLKR